MRALPLPVVRRLGEGLGLMFYLVDRVHRRIALANLEVAFPKKSDEECRAIAKSMFQHFGRLLLELLKYLVAVARNSRWRWWIGKAKSACGSRSHRARASCSARVILASGSSRRWRTR